MIDLKSWVESQSSFPECLRPEDIEHSRRQRLTYLESGQTPTVVQSEDGFLAWDTSASERDTQRPLALLWASQGEVDTLLEQSKREFNELPLVASAFFSQGDWCETLLRYGFYPLRSFVSKPMSRQSVSYPFTIRLGKESDRSFLTALAVTVASHTLPPHRKSELSAYNRILTQSLLKLDYSKSSEHRLYIAEDQGRQRVGYLLLRLDDRKTAWVVDIGVQKSHWGQGVAQFLVLTAENHLIEEGFEFYVGEISASNERSFYVATKLCSFQPNRQLWRFDNETAVC